MNIKSRRWFDVMAVILSVSGACKPTRRPPAADVHFVADAVVVVWGPDNIEQCRSRVRQPLLFLNIAAKYDDRPDVDLWRHGARMTRLKEFAAREHFVEERDQVASKRESTWDADKASRVLTGDALPSYCAFSRHGFGGPERDLATPVTSELNKAR